MANTYTKLSVHCVFAVKGRQKLLSDAELRKELFSYMHGILKNDGVYALAIGGWQDHVHVFIELPPTRALSDIIRHLKAVSSKWLNANKVGDGKFNWQSGFGAFTHSHSQRNNVIQYILKQEEHHSRKPFREEYLAMLEQNAVEFDDKYVFNFED